MIAAWLLGSALCMATADGPAGVSEADRAAYQTAAAAAGRNASAHVDLALWCEARGMAAEKSRHLARAVLLDPENARARGLLGQVKRDGRWMRPAEVARALEASPEKRSLMDEYLARRAATKDRADDQYELALWCEEKGLKEPMVAHLRRTLQLDPDREGAWRRLGFKKSGGRWVNPEVEAAAKAAREAAIKADKEWTPRLEKLRDALFGRDEAKKAEAAATLAAIRDPRAVPSLFRAFGRGGNAARQAVAVDVLSRIDGPDASLALAALAVHSPHPTIRTDAAALLSRRDPREFAGYLALQLRDEVKYKARPVDGPGSIGELFVEGDRVNVRRVYRPMDAPMLMPGDQIVQDANGNVLIDRPVGYGTGFLPLPGFVAFAGQNPSRDVAVGVLERAGVPAELAGTVANRMEQRAERGAEFGRMLFGSSGTRYMPVYRNSVQFSRDQILAEARASAMAARAQLQSDVAGIETHNAPIREINERAAAILKAISGEDRGEDRGKWMSWVLDLQGYAQPLRAASSPPDTVVEEVPIAYQPRVTPMAASTVVGFIRRHSCFAAGTPVRTLRGDRPIESILPGDLVLAQDTTTGSLDYKPVVEALRNPPASVFGINLEGGETIRATGIHRFWKAGEGWTLARDLKPGDRLRVVGGVAAVASVETAADARPVPVFNLRLAGGDNYHVGAIGLLAHDNGPIEPVAAPFDAVR